MAMKYWYRMDPSNHGSSTILPVAGNPTYTIPEMDPAYTIGNVVAVFTDSTGTPVTPTGNGTIRFEASPTPGIWLEPPAEMIINVTEFIVAPGLATFTIPSFDGPVVASRFILGGTINTATHVMAYHWRAST